MSSVDRPPHLRAVEGLAPESATRLIEALVALVKPRFPIVVDREVSNRRSFAVYGPALVADAVATVEGIAHLAELQREADTHSLLRDLVEAAITFAWLAIDPDPHIEAWLLADKRARVKVDNALQTFGQQVLDPTVRTSFDQAIAAGGPSFPDALGRAKQADLAWTSRLPRLKRVVEGSRVFELLYELVFRYTSAFTHSMPMAVMKLIEPVQGGAVVVLEGTVGPQRALTFAPSVFGVLLYVASEVLGWPLVREIDEVFDSIVAAP
jgi:hypothetical protein